MITPLVLPAHEPGEVADRNLLRRLACVLGLLAVLTSITGIIGNMYGAVIISSVCPGCKTMALSASVVWGFFGAVLIYGSLRPIRDSGRILLRSVLVCLAVVECLEILWSLRGMHFIVESWFVAAGSVIFGAASTPISPEEAALIILTAAGLFFWSEPVVVPRNAARIREVTAGAGILVSLSGFTLVMSYLYKNPLPYGPRVIPIAVLSALTAFFIGNGLIAAAGPETSPVCYFMGPSIRATLLRTFVTFIVVVLLVDNLLFYVISSWFQISDAVMISGGLLVFTLATAGIAGRLSGTIGEALDKAERELLRKNEDLLELNEELKAAKEDLRKNVDELTKKEQNLRESEHSLYHSREILEAVTSGTNVIIAAVDRDMRYTFFNKPYREEILRLTGKDITIGSGITEPFEDMPDQQQVVQLEWKIPLQGERTNTRLEFGEPGLYRRTYNVLHTPMRNAAGEVIGAGEVAFDITREVKAEEALRESERFLKETQKIARLGSWKANPYTDYLQWTEGIYTITEAPRTSCPAFSEGLAYFSPEDRSLIRSKIETCLSKGEAFSLETEITTETGRKVWTELRGLATITEGARTSVIGTFQDITGLRQIRKKLEKEIGKRDILEESARLLLSAENPEAIVQIVGERVMQYLNCHIFFNYLLDETGQRLQLNAFAGIPPGEYDRIEYLNLGDAICGQVALGGERIVVSDCFSTGDDRCRLIRSFGISSYVCHPLVYQGRTLGTLSFGRCTRVQFTDEELELMRAVTDLVAVAMARKKTEDSLRKTSQYLENLLDYANAPIIVWDTEFRIQRFNHAFEFLTGMNADLVMGKPLDILFPEKSRWESMELIQKTSSGERWESVEIPIQHISGAIKIVLWNSANIYDADGISIFSTIAQGQDITARKNAEESALKTASLLNAALDSTADGILVVDNAGYITSYNRIFCSFWGIPERTLDGARESTALAFMTPLIKDPREFTARLKEYYAHPVRESYDTVSLADGRIFERYSKPQMVGDSIVGRVWSYRDITRFRQAEEALRESLEKFRIIATHTPDHILVQDRDLRYTQVFNPQLGLTAEDMIGFTDYDILSKEEADHLTRIKRQVLESGTIAHLEIPLVGANGEKNYFAGSLIPKRNASGETEGIIGYLRNVTESKLANEKIVAALAEKEILIREIHHRVKNNLQIISGLLDMTRMRTQDPATTGILTDMMMKIRTMAQIHTRLYESRQFDRINMGVQIRDQVADLSSIYGRSGPAIACEVDAEDLLLTVDQAIPCALVVNEALSNAFKHAFRGRQRGTIMVSAWKEGENIRIRVQDDGVGIPENVDISRATSLGLKLIRSLVLQLQGTLAVESDATGSVVNVEFPFGRGG